MSRKNQPVPGRTVLCPLLHYKCHFAHLNRIRKPPPIGYNTHNTRIKLPLPVEQLRLRRPTALIRTILADEIITEVPT